MSTIAREAWRTSRTQATFSVEDADAVALWRFTADHRPQLCRLTLLILTNTVHWRRDPDTSHVYELQCPGCQVSCTVTHLVNCPSTARRRADAAIAIGDLFSAVNHLSLMAEFTRWRATGAADVRELIVYLRLAAGPVQDTGVDAAVIGAFRREAGIEFCKRWRVAPSLINSVRGILIVWTTRAFCALLPSL